MTTFTGNVRVTMIINGVAFPCRELGSDTTSVTLFDKTDVIQRNDHALIEVVVDDKIVRRLGKVVANICVDAVNFY